MSPVVIVSLLMGIVLLLWFFLDQRGKTDGVLPLRLFADRARAVVFINLVIAGAILMAMTVQVALFVQEVLEYTPLQAGVAFIPFAIGLGGGAAIAGWAVQRVSPRWVIVAGGALMVAAFSFAMGMGTHVSYPLQLLPSILLIAAGVGLALIPLTLCVVAGVRPIDVGPLTATSLVAQTLGGPLGLAAATAVAESVTRHRLGEALDAVDRAHLTTQAREALGQGYTTSLMVCAGLALVIIALSAAFINFTPSDVAEGKKAEAQANEGLG